MLIITFNYSITILFFAGTDDWFADQDSSRLEEVIGGGTYHFRRAEDLVSHCITIVYGAVGMT